MVTRLGDASSVAGLMAWSLGDCARSAVAKNGGARCRPRALRRCRGPKASRPWHPWMGEKAERKEGLCGDGQEGDGEGEGLVWLL